MNVTLWIVIAYLIVVIAVGQLLRVRKGGVRDFFVAGGQLSWFLLVPFLMGEFTSTTATVGTAEMAHRYGVVTIWFFVGTPMGLTLLAFGLVKFYVSLKGTTIGEVFALLFDQRNRLICASFLLIATTMTASVAFLGLGTILAPLLGVSYETGVWISTALLVLLATFGLKGIAAMNIIHLVTIIVTFVVATLASLIQVGGPASLIASLPAEHLDFTRLGWPTIVAWILSGFFIMLISTLAIMGMFAARDEKTARVAAIATSVWVLVFSFLPVTIGLAAYVLMPDTPSRLALWNMGEACGPGVSTLLALGVLAAVISTTPGLLLSLSGLATRDLFLSLKPDAGEKSQMTFSLLIIPVLGFVGTVFALTQPTIIELVTRMAQIRAIFAIVLVVSIMWRRIHADAALLTTTIGAGTAVIWFILNSPFGVEPLWPGIGTGVLVLIVSSFFKKPSPYKGTVET